MKLNELFRKIGVGAAFVGVAIIFCACENFMKGADVKKELERQIYIAGQDCPVAKVEEPAWTNDGVGKNRAIIISFTKSMATENFLDCLTITDEMGNDIKKNFLAPQWYNENKYVTIAASETNPISFGGKKTMDVKVTLSKAFQTPDGLPITNAIEHTYRIADKTDTIAPEIKKVKGELPPEFIGRTASEKKSELIEGNLTAQNEETICKTNHINTKVNFYIEGNDRGASVWANIMYRRCYDTMGKTVNEDFKSYLEKLETITDGGNSSGTVCLELPRGIYSDGMYEVRVYVQNASAIKSAGYYTYYIIRDTINTFNYATAVGFWAEQFRSIEDFSFFGQNGCNDWEHVKQYIQGKIDDAEANPDDEEKKWDGPHYIDWYQWQLTVPTGEYLNDIANGNNINFDNIPEDIYFTSVFSTGKTYKDSLFNYKYYMSWGLDLDNMTTPVEIIGEKTEEYILANPTDNNNFFPLPENFKAYRKEHEDKDIYLRAIYKDSAGNENIITGLAPKKVDIYNYKVEDDTENSTEGKPKKKVTINFDDISKADTKLLKTLPDKKIRVFYRIFYTKLENNHPTDDAYYDSLELKRSCVHKFDHDFYDSEIFTGNYTAPKTYLNVYGNETLTPDFRHVIKNLEPNSYYLVYLQADYETDSLYNNEWNGSYFSPLTRIIVETSSNGSNKPTAPTLTMNKESAGKNTGRFNVTITLDQETFNSNGENTKYIPCFSTDGTNWIYYESQKQREFTIAVQNPLHMPVRDGEAWWYVEENNDWANFSTVGNNPYDNSYWDAVEGCKYKGYPDVIAYPDVTALVKIIAVNEENLLDEETAPEELKFTEADDNIPPYTETGLLLHDSRLSYDGSYFLFESVIREDEGHLSDTFEYYYTPYQESWGNNLSVLSREEIEALPHNTGYFDSSTWINCKDKERTQIERLDYWISAKIPIDGLEDGQYMFFGYFTDTYGNDTFITLGKANVGTFENPLKVKYELVEDSGVSGKEVSVKKYDAKGNENGRASFTFNYPKKNVYHFKTSLELSGKDPQDSNTKYMIHIKKFWDGGSGDLYGYDNELQYCVTGLDEDGKYSVLYETENIKDAIDNKRYIIEMPLTTNGIKFDTNEWLPDNTGYITGYDTDKSGNFIPAIPPQLNLYDFYRITVQAFNLEEYSDESGRGVNLRYGRPYSTYDSEVPNWKWKWRGSFTWVEGGEKEYDLCTRETVSYPVYVYLPPLHRRKPDGSEYNQAVDGDNYILCMDENFFEGIKASFTPANARPRSNRPFLVNVIACSRDLGNNPNEWERRGKLIASHMYDPDWNTSELRFGQVQFDSTTAADDMYNSDEKGYMYYVAVVHFANGESAVSDVYSTYCY